MNSLNRYRDGGDKTGKKEFWNHLWEEVSPYLLQHASNPVDWYPWGEAAFQKAIKEDKPIFLSIGYSTCHWCHVMAHESFEDPQVGERMNQVFVCIKVDREERPDVDAVYMEACQAMNGSGGWPLNVILTPDQKPFFAATYMPKTTRFGHLGLLELTDEVERQWKGDRSRLLSAGDQLADWLRRRAEGAVPETERQSGRCDLIDRSVVIETAEAFARRYDQTWGGFGRAPKFPMGHILLFLLRFGELELWEKDKLATGAASSSIEASTAATTSIHMAEHTLEQMYRGGIYDHLGGGFSRYSTDEMWLVPHFEKMLYDNCLLTLAYLQAWKMTGRPLYSRVARETLAYMEKELQGEAGGFVCGQDADSDGHEGKFYVFHPEEIQEVLGKGKASEFCHRYGITQQGNFEGQSVLNRLDREQSSHTLDQIPDRVEEETRHSLYDYRRHRCQLHRDNKVLTSWNGLALAAYSQAFGLLGDHEYRQTAEKLRQFVHQNIIREDGRLYLRWVDGDVAVEGQLLDYSCYAWGLLELYDVTWNVDYMEEAQRMVELAEELFSDQEKGGYFMYSSETEQLISRPKEAYDGAMPSGNSVMALVLSRLWQLTGSERWRQASQRQLDWLALQNGAGSGSQWEMTGSCFGCLAILEELYPSWQLICVTGDGSLPEEVQQRLRELKKGRRANGSVLVKTSGNEERLSRMVPMTASYPIPENGVNYYYCCGGTCHAPVSDWEQLSVLMQQ